MAAPMRDASTRCQLAVEHITCWKGREAGGGKREAGSGRNQQAVDEVTCLKPLRYVTCNKLFNIPNVGRQRPGSFVFLALL
jgi:hypothetical protein